MMRAERRHTLMMMVAIWCIAVTAVSCGVARKLSTIRSGSTRAGISIPEHLASTGSMSQIDVPAADTIKVVDFDGKEMFLMSSVVDEDGNVVAGQVLEAAVVVAKFRNVAERNGQVDISFSIVVPESMHDSEWQIRYTPTMFIMGAEQPLDKVLVTGEQYRKRQLRGYEHYQRFLNTIITDTTAFIDLNALEIFLQRNIPQLYAFRNDSSFVDDSVFEGVFGVSQREALDHYTNHLAVKANDNRKGRSGRKYKKYVKAPIVKDGVRLDTVLRDGAGNYVYDYVQTIAAGPRLRKVDVVLDGEVYEQNTKLADIPRSDTITFFISSLSALVDGRERFVTKIVERVMKEEVGYNIDFALGASVVDPSLGDNSSELSRIKKQLDILLEDKIFNLDSVTVVSSCSPEGAYASNAALSRRRSAAISSYFSAYMAHKTDSLKASSGVMLNLDDSWSDDAGKYAPVEFSSNCIPENWDYLSRLVEEDGEMTITHKEEFFALMDIKDPDKREASMRRESWFGHLKEKLYPRLRSVHFRFALSRKDMHKDTVHTTVLDTVYMAGVSAIRDRDYDAAARILAPYEDFNTAVAYLALDRNHNALTILEKCPHSAAAEYMKAIAYSRLGEMTRSVQCYLDACNMDSQFIHRGNLDPEISYIIRRYNLNHNN